MFSDVISHIIQNKSQLETQIKQSKDSLNQLVNDYKSTTKIDNLETCKQQIITNYEQQQENQMNLKYKLIEIQQKSSTTYQDFKRLKNKRTNIEKTMDTVTYMVQLKNIIPLFQGAIQASNLKECIKILQTITKCKTHLIESACTNELSQIQQLSITLQQSTDTLLKQAVSHNDITLISQCSTITDILTSNTPTTQSAFIFNLTIIYQHKLRDELSTIYLNLNQMSLNDLIDPSDEDNTCIIITKFEEVLEKTGITLTQICQNTGLQEPDILWTLMKSMLEQDMLVSIFKALFVMLNTYYHNKDERDLYLDEMAHVSYQIYSLFTHIMSLLKQSSQSQSQSQSLLMLNQYESSPLVQMNQEQLIIYIKEEQNYLKQKIDQNLLSTTLSSKISQELHDMYSLSSQTKVIQYTAINVIDIFYVAKQTLKRAISTRSLMAITAIVNHIKHMFTTLFTDYVQTILDQSLNIKAFQKAYKTHHKPVYIQYLVILINDQQTMIDYLAKLKEYIIQEYQQFSINKLITNNDMVLASTKDMQNDSYQSFNQLLNSSVNTLSLCIKSILATHIEQYRILDFIVKQEDLYEKTAKAHYADILVKDFRKTIQGYQKNMKESVFEKVMDRIVDTLFKELISIILNQRFNLIGVIYLDKEMRQLVAFFQGFQRNKVFQQINTICVVLMQENKQEFIELIELYKEDLALDAKQIEKLKNLRVDL